MIRIEQVQNLRALIAEILRRVVQKDELRPVPRRLERCLEPADLAQHDLPVVRLAFGLLIKPTARTADGIIAVEVAVIIENVHGVHVVRRKKAVGLFGSAPPEVVIALEQNLFPGQSLDELKVRQRLLHGHAPGKITAEHADIVVVQGRKTKFDFFYIIFPRSAKYVHGLICAQRQMQVADCIQCHLRSSVYSAPGCTQ